MSGDTMIMIFPEYMRDFSCIGSSCNDSCCVGWRVDIDKDTYQDYRKYAGDEELRGLLDKYIKRNRTVKSDFQYAKVKMLPGNKCPFLNEKMLCKIQLAMGGEKLSHVCMTYPRKYTRVNKTVNLSATLSCPEVARYALLSKDGIKFVNEPLDHYPKMRYALDREMDLKKPFPAVVRYYYDILAASISILQCRQFGVDTRMILLGFFTKKLYELFTAKSPEDSKEQLQKILSDFENMDVLESYAKGTEKFEVKLLAQLILLQKMSLSALGETKGSIKFGIYMFLAVKAIFGGKANNAVILKDYGERGIALYNEFMGEKGYVLENYLVNTMFEQSFPINGEDPAVGGNDIFLSYMRLVVKYVILRTTVVGLLMRGDKPDEKYLVDMIQTYTKKIHHSPKVLNEAVDYLKGEGTYTLAGAALLLKL